MTTVADVADEVGLPTGQVLDACRSLDIVASSGASGLSAEEHRRLRDALDAHDDLPPVPAGSSEHRPGPRPLVRPPAPRGARLSPRTASRVAVSVFLVVAVIVGVAALRDRADGDQAACVDLDGAQAGAQVATVPCDEPHDAELLAVHTVPDQASYPGSEAVVAEAERVCTAAFEAHVGRPDAESSLDAVFLVPTSSTWAAGDRTILCLVEDPDGPLTDSVAGSGR